MRSLFVGTVVLAFTAGAPVAWAASDTGPTVAEELLDIVRAAGIIDDAKYEELRERAQQEHKQRVEEAVREAVAVAEAAKPVPTSSEPEPAPTDWTATWNNGFKVERNDGAFKLSFGGRVQNDWALIDESNELEESIGGEGNGTEFRRAYLFFEGTVYDRLILKSQFDLASTGSGTVTFRDVYMGLKDLGPIGTAWVGHKKEPFSLEELTSDKYLTFLERGLPNVFAPSRNTGLMAANTAFDEKLLWGFGIFHDANGDGFGFDDNSAWNVTGRVAATPFYADDGARVVHLGVGFSHEFRGGDFAQSYQQRPESHLAAKFLDTEDIPTDDINLLGVEFATVMGPASFQAEYMHSWVEGRHSPDTDFWGAYAQASFFLTGEHRNYTLDQRTFGRVKPGKNFNPQRGDWGAWEIAARFSYLDLEDQVAEGGKMWDVTAALNWYLYPNARVMLNYIHSHVADRVVVGTPLLQGVDGDADILQARFQFDF